MTRNRTLCSPGRGFIRGLRDTPFRNQPTALRVGHICYYLLLQSVFPGTDCCLRSTCMNERACEDQGACWIRVFASLQTLCLWSFIRKAPPSYQGRSTKVVGMSEECWEGFDARFVCVFSRGRVYILASGSTKMHECVRQECFYRIIRDQPPWDPSSVL